MIGRLADAVNRMFATEKVQEQNSGNHISRNDKANIESFEKQVIDNSNKISEVKDTYQSKHVKKDEEKDEEKKKKKDRESRRENETDSEEDEKNTIKKIRIDKKV